MSPFSTALFLSAITLATLTGCKKNSAPVPAPSSGMQASASASVAVYEVMDPTGQRFVVSTPEKAAAAQRGEFTNASSMTRGGKTAMVENNQPGLAEAYFGGK